MRHTRCSLRCHDRPDGPSSADWCVVSETDEVRERTHVGRERGSQDAPLMLPVRIGYFDDGPIQIGHVKRNGLADTVELVVVQEDDASGTHQSAEVEQVDEYGVEAMITIYEGEIERRG